MSMDDKLREARNAGIAGWAVFLIIVGAVVASSRCGPPDAPVPSPSATASPQQ